jgi:hypothetical protein
MFSVDNVVDRGGLELGPEARTPEARRAAFLDRLLALGAESAELVLQKNALGKQKGDAKKREAILERLEKIEVEEAAITRNFCMTYEGGFHA